LTGKSGSLFKLFVSKGKWYLLSSLLTKGLAFLIMPIYTNNLSIDEYGKLDSFNSITQIFVIFISLYIDSALARFYHLKKDAKEDLQELFSTTVMFVLLYGSLVLSLTLASSGYWFRDFFNVAVWPYSFLIFASALLQQIFQLGIVFFSQELKASRVAMLQMVFSFGSAILGIFFLLVLGFGLLAKLYAVFFVSLALSIYTLVYFYRRGLLRFNLNKHVLKESLLYSIPLLPNILGGWILGLSDRLILAKYMTFSTVGVYSVGAQLSKLLYIIHDVYTKVQGPVSLSLLAEDEETAKNKISSMSFSLLCIMLAAHYTLLVFVDVILLIFNKPEYQNAAYIIGILGAAHIFTSQYRVFTINLMHKGKTFVIAIAAIISAIINVLLNITFIPEHGFLAASWSTFFSVLIYFIWIFYWSQSYIKIELPWKSIVIAVFVYLVSVSLYLTYFQDYSFDNSITLYFFKAFLAIVNCVFFAILLKVGTKGLLRK
jgi:O-antigen/teichoic acid export membrane protein